MPMINLPPDVDAMIASFEEKQAEYQNIIDSGNESLHEYVIYTGENRVYTSVVDGRCEYASPITAFGYATRHQAACVARTIRNGVGESGQVCTRFDALQGGMNDLGVLIKMFRTGSTD